MIDFALANTMTLLGMNTLCRGLIFASLVLMSTAFIGCEAGSMRAKGANASAVATSRLLTSGDIAPILLFNGTGTSPNDVAAVETILSSNHLNYSSVNSSQLNEMGESQMRGYRLLIVPGGNFIDIGNSLTSSTTANIRKAVQNGLNYLGICAGGFFAGNSPYNGLNLTSGVRFSFYAAENRGSARRRWRLQGPGDQLSISTGRMARSLPVGVRLSVSLPTEPPQSWKEHSEAGG